MPEFGMKIKDLVSIYDHCMKNSVKFFKWQLTATHQSQNRHSVPFVDLVATWCGNSFCLFLFFYVWQCCRSTGLFFCDIFLFHSSNLWGKKKPVSYAHWFGNLFSNQRNWSNPVLVSGLCWAWATLVLFSKFLKYQYNVMMWDWLKAGISHPLPQYGFLLSFYSLLNHASVQCAILGIYCTTIVSVIVFQFPFWAVPVFRTEQ